MIVLDTHTWVWWVSVSPELSSAAAEAIDDAAADGSLRVSSISVWEVAMLVRAGRLELRMDVEDWVAESENLPFLEFVPVDNRIAAHSTVLPGSFHADPADRMIVATARTLGAHVVTKDRKIRRYRHVKTIW